MGRRSSYFEAWLRQYVGEIEIAHPEVPRALAGLPAPTATFNYDTLVERATGRVARSWKSGAAMQHALYENKQDLVPSAEVGPVPMAPDWEAASSVRSLY